MRTACILHILCNFFFVTVFITNKNNDDSLLVFQSRRHYHSTISLSINFPILLCSPACLRRPTAPFPDTTIPTLIIVRYPSQPHLPISSRHIPTPTTPSRSRHLCNITAPSPTPYATPLTQPPPKNFPRTIVPKPIQN